MRPYVEPFFDPATSTFSYVVYEADGGACAVIDAVLDYDLRSGRTATRSAERIIDFVRARGLNVVWLLETHAHADHLSAAAWLRQQLGGKIGISARIRDVRQAFRHTFNLGPEFCLDGSQFDYLFEADEAFRIGNLAAVAMHVPGHTPADIAYRVGDTSLFVGDTLFMPDVGTARCDFPGGCAAQLYRSIRRILALPDGTRLYLCHDYPPDSRLPSCCSTVRQQRMSNIHVRDGITKSEFIAMRTRRDAELDLPLLILPSIQVNIQAGTMPPPELNGVRYLKIPINLL
jgi:glyoxylase-like metal-dependent hydrolase (beta-lactamase superfamily II)